MKTFAIVLIVAGIALIVIRGFSVTTEKKVLDIGPVEVNKKQDKWIGWPSYVGIVVSAIGVILLVSVKKKTP